LVEKKLAFALAAFLPSLIFVYPCRSSRHLASGTFDHRNRKVPDRRLEEAVGGRRRESSDWEFGTDREVLSQGGTSPTGAEFPTINSVFDQRWEPQGNETHHATAMITQAGQLLER